jgi:hypothetical protein
VNRHQAERLIEDVRAMLALRRDPEHIERKLRRVYGIEPLEHCPGEAHANPHIDHCSQCMPRWGFLGAKVEIT